MTENWNHLRIYTNHNAIQQAASMWLHWIMIQIISTLKCESLLLAYPADILIWRLVICNGLSDEHFTRLGNGFSELCITFYGRYLGNPKGASYPRVRIHEYLWNYCIRIWQHHMLRTPDFKTNIFWHPASHYPLILTNFPCNVCSIQANHDWFSCSTSVRFVF